MMRLDCDDDCNENKEKDEKGLTQDLLKARTVIVSEVVSKDLAKKIYAQLLVLNDRSQTDPIYVYVNSPGGDADSGFGIYDMLKFVEAPVITVVCGLCASAGVTIFLGADKGKNYCTPNARFLLHQPSTGISGTASDIEITAREIEKTRERYNQIVCDVTGKNMKTVTKDADRDFWLSPEEAVKYGLVSKIIQNRGELK